MAQQELKKGDVIRRKLSTSSLSVGGYKVIDDVARFGVYAHNIPQDALGSCYYLKESIAKIPHLVLRISNNEIKSIIEDRLSWVQHLLNKSWNAAYVQQYSKDKAVVITLCSNTSYLVVTEPIFRIVVCDGKQYIKLEFVRILESVVR